MSQATPLVSVIMPTRNRASMLAQAIDSIRQQTLTDWQLIITDDASSDNTPDVLRAYSQKDPRIQYHRFDKQQGAATARNVAIQRARGRYIALQDDDDISLPTRLAKQIAFLKKHQHIDLVGCLVAYFDKHSLTPSDFGKDWSSYVAKRPAIQERYDYDFFICIGTLVGKTDVFQKIPYRPFFQQDEDYDFLVRCSEHYNIEIMPKILYHYRQGDYNKQSHIKYHHLVLEYKCIVWTSSFHRFMGWQDPIDRAKNNHDVFHHTHPDFQNKASKKITWMAEDLIDRACHHITEINTQQILHIYKFVSNMAEKKGAKRLRTQVIMTYLEKYWYKTYNLFKIKNVFYKNNTVFIFEMVGACLIRRKWWLIKPALRLTQKIPRIKKTTPLVSVIMATRNRASMLAQAIDSIRQQTWTHWQLIIIDDASTDDTPAILRAYSQKDSRIQYHRFEHQQGPALARNAAIRHAQGSLIALQDDDDLSRPSRLAEQVAFFKENPDIHLIGTWLEILNERGRFFETHWTSRANKLPPLGRRAEMPLLFPCIMGYRYVFETIPMRPFFCLCEDYDFLLRCIERYNLSHIPQALYLYRHKDPSHQTLTTQSELKVLKYHFAAWLSAYYRAQGQPDPIEQGRDIDTILQQGRRIFQKAPKQAQKILFYRYGIDHAKDIWHRKRKNDMTLLLQWFRSITTKDVYANFLMRFTMDCRKKDTTFAIIKRLCTDYKDYVPTHALIFTAKKIMRLHIYRQDKTAFLLWVSFLAPSHILRIGSTIIWTCVWKRQFDFIPPFLKALNKKTISQDIPLVSVIMATRNRSSMLTQAIDSIRKQTWTHWQLIIIDDASHDDTPAILRAYSQKDPRIQYHRFEHQQGPAVARNAAINHAQGSLIALQDDDDLSLPSRLAEQVSFLTYHPDIHLIGTWLETINGKKHILKTSWTSRANKPPPLGRRAEMPLFFPSIMGHRHVFKTLPMRPFFPLCEDYDFLLRCLERYNLAHIPRPLYLYRQSRSSHQQISTQSDLKILKYHFATWLSAYYRTQEQPDPIEQGRDIDTILSEGRPIFQKAPKQAKKILFYRYGIEHAKNIWHRKQKHDMTLLLQWFSSITTKDIYANFLMRFTMDCRKNETTFAIIKRLCTDYKDYVPTDALIFTAKKIMRRHIARHDKKTFLLWVSFLAPPHILKISPTILWTCVWKRQFGFIPPFIQALSKKR